MEELINLLNNKYSTIIQGNSKESDFNINFPIPLELNEAFNYRVALQWFSVYNRVFNVNTTNNCFKYDQKLYKLTPGAYEVKDIFQEINAMIPDDTKIEAMIKMNFSKVKIIKTYKILDFNVKNSIGKILGLDKQIIQPHTSVMGNERIDISNIQSINIMCDLVQNCFLDGKRSNLLYSFPYGTVTVGNKIVESPNPIIYLPITRKTISSINFRICDQKGNLLSFNGEEISLALHIKQI